jgi:AmmeMemoRadiSam system protein B
MPGVRPAAVAGRFYPADPAALADEVDRLLEAARPGPHAARPVAAIAPHAGYRYSGAVAAESWAHVARVRDDIRRVLLLGPAHYAPLRGMAVPAADAFATPLGAVAVDADARSVATELPDVRVDDVPHGPEHSLETQLPFLQRTLAGDVRVLPVLVGVTAPAVASRLVAALLGDDTVAVVSTDLSHYLDRRTAERRDRRTADAIVAGDESAVGADDACGSRPLRGLLHLVAERRLDVELLRLATSPDVGADPGRVVGYGAFLVHARGR